MKTPEVSPSCLVILTVCEGNICRSPLVKFALEQELSLRNVPHRVTSAGLQALTGHGMDPSAEEAAWNIGVETGPHSAQRLTGELVRSADVVLTMTRRQRDAVVSRFPRELQKVFSLQEFSKLSESLPAGLTPADISMQRSAVSLTAEDDVTDPYKRPMGVHAEVASVIVSASKTIAGYFA